MEKEIDLKLLSIKVPQLVLQPMIENAVVHGIERIKQGIIKIKIHSDVENVYLQVMNSGKPLTKEAKERIEILLNQRPGIVGSGYWRLPRRWGIMSRLRFGILTSG